MNKLIEYGTTTYTECLVDMVKLITKRGIDAAILILAEVRAPFSAFSSSAQTMQIEVPDAAFVPKAALAFCLI